MQSLPAPDPNASGLRWCDAKYQSAGHDDNTRNGAMINNRRHQSAKGLEISFLFRFGLAITLVVLPD